MKRRERGQQRRDGEEDRRKLSCVMYGHGSKASISFTKPRSMSNLRLNNLQSAPTQPRGERTRSFSHSSLLAHFFCFAVSAFFSSFLCCVFFFVFCFWKSLKINVIMQPHFDCVDKAHQPNPCFFGNPWLNSLSAFQVQMSHLALACIF